MTDKKVVVINDKYSAERDFHGWKLYQTYTGKDKDGNDKQKVHTTYHSNLKQICDAVIDRDAGLYESLTELKDMLSTASEVMLASLEAAK